MPGLDIYYLYGNPHDDRARGVVSRYVGSTVPVVQDDAICQIGDVLIAGCADHLQQQEDCFLRKRLIALASEFSCTSRPDQPASRRRSLPTSPPASLTSTLSMAALERSS